MMLMREFGIDQIQGFHVGRPIPAERFRAQLAAIERVIPLRKSA